MKSFEDALTFTLSFEGGKSDDPDDPGKRTAYGITQATYDGFRRAKGRPQQDVWLIQEDERAELYREEFWNRVHCDDHEWPLSLVLFDATVHHGPKLSVPWLVLAEWADVSPQLKAYAFLTLRRQFLVEWLRVHPKWRGVLGRVDALRRAAELA